MPQRAEKIIVGGLPRSGSTLLRYILDASDEIIAGPETGFLLRPLSETILKLDKVVPKISDKLGVQAEDIKDCVSSGRSSVHAFDLLMSRYKNLVGENKRVWAEKTPRNCYHYDRLSAEDSSVFFISTVRNGLDVVTSEYPLSDKRYQRRRYWVSIQQYIDCMRSIYSFKNPRHFVVKYEDLCRSPERTIEVLFFRLGLKYTQDCLLRYKISSRTRDPKKVIQPKVLEPIQTTWIERWKERKHAEIVTKFLSDPDAMHFFSLSGYSLD